MKALGFTTIQPTNSLFRDTHPTTKILFIYFVSDLPIFRTTEERFANYEEDLKAEQRRTEEAEKREKGALQREGIMKQEVGFVIKSPCHLCVLHIHASIILSRKRIKACLFVSSFRQLDSCQTRIRLFELKLPNMEREKNR